ncbi:hypothetical protein [Chondromyces apiculatus]|uniref:hypothetical protein n=1 Tax=Chondromyces apiculatus TaxID=51 RepID=UPI001E3FDBA0|nr:hypothetical protein [Chondromyces apiculatus]
MRSNLDRYLQEPGVSEGQRSRLRLFQSMETNVCTKVERFCTDNGVEVTDLAVLIVAPEAHVLFQDALKTNPGRVAGRGGEGSVHLSALPSASVILGHRTRLHAFLRAALPTDDAEVQDPYRDLLVPSPMRCVRILIIDSDSITIMSYGTFVTVQMDLASMPDA